MGKALNYFYPLGSYSVTEQNWQSSKKNLKCTLSLEKVRKLLTF